MARAVVALAVLWPLAMSGAVAARQNDSQPWFAAGVYVIAGRVCHQRPERSFHTHDVQWPVCGRCTGLYLAAAVGAIAALGRRPLKRSAAMVLLVAALPTAATLVLEWSGVPMTSIVRFLSALPLGFAAAFIAVRTADGSARGKLARA